MSTIVNDPKQIKQPDVITNELETLKVRSERLSRFGWRFIVSSIVASIVVFGLSFWFEPDVLFKTVHLPDEVISLFSESSGVTQNKVFATKSLKLLALVIIWLLRIIGIIAIISAVVKEYNRSKKCDTEDENYEREIIVQWLCGLLFLLAVPNAVDNITQNAVMNVSQQTFVSYVKKANYQEVQKSLQEIKASDATKSYILAQVALVQANSSGKPLDTNVKTELVEHVKLLDKAMSGKMEFEVSPQAVYAVEVAAMGKPVSAVATKYLHHFSHWEDLTLAGKFIAGLFALIGGGMLFLGRRIRFRLKRSTSRE